MSSKVIGIRERIREVEDSTRHGEHVRHKYARKSRRGNVARRAEIEHAVKRINKAQAAVRSDLGKLAWSVALDRTYGDQLRAASAAGQAERRKLRKML